MITISELTPRLYEMLSDAVEQRGRESTFDHYRWCMSKHTFQQITFNGCDSVQCSCATKKIIGIEVELCDCIPDNTIELRYSIGSVAI